MQLIDSHCHFDEGVFDHDRAELVQAMQKVGVTDLVFPAVSAQTWPRLQQVCATSKQFHASYGLHPMYIDQHREADIDALRDWLTKEQPVAVGECGLDFYVPGLDQQRQIDIFVQQLYLAQVFDLPLIIHVRKAQDQVLKYIRQVGNLRGVVHSFSGSLQQAERFIEHGFYLGIGGSITYERAQRLRKVVASVPLERIVLETDAPDQPDSQWRGRRNDPTRLPVIAAQVAAITGHSLATVATTTTVNAQHLFGL